jgi:hypothetical protein
LSIIFKDQFLHALAALFKSIPLAKKIVLC